MSKILVEVYSPAAGSSYDAFIPLESKMYEVAYLLANTVSELSQGYFKANPEQTIICDRSTGQVFDINRTVEELGLENGAKLMLL
ncbi:methyltransferase [Neobacillus mesonae]|uniref:methyltransferase n=1 Tax=Neobacillus mesonae TaxID=1193713 RepID=UPI00203B5972|nr:methyltransferase [Neobacillus mesonae]MCM3567292.1 methyltransferase [Neobacillus mesonae]